MRVLYTLTLLVSLLELGQTRLASPLYSRDAIEIAPRELVDFYYRDLLDLYDRNVPREDDFSIFERDADAIDELEARDPEFEHFDYSNAVRRRAERSYAEFVKRAFAKPALHPAAGKPTAGKPTAGKPTAGKPTAGKPTAGKPTAGKPKPGSPGPATQATSGTARYQKVHEAIHTLGLSDGKYAFYRIWPQSAHGAGHEDLDQLTADIHGSHYALVVGTLGNGDFVGFSADLRFTSGRLTKANGNGQPVASTVVQYATSTKDASELHFLGKVSHVDQATVVHEGTNALHSTTYDVKTNNCKSYVDNLYKALH